MNSHADRPYRPLFATGPVKRRKRRFVRPTVDEVAAYCRERGNRVSAEHFIDHYTANGWKVGRTPMKDWRAAVRTWEHMDRARNGHDQHETVADRLARIEKANQSRDQILRGLR